MMNEKKLLYGDVVTPPDDTFCNVCKSRNLNTYKTRCTFRGVVQLPITKAGSEFTGEFYAYDLETPWTCRDCGEVMHQFHKMTEESKPLFDEWYYGLAEAE